MKQRLLKSVAASFEWRIIAFIITEIFFLMTTGHLWQSTILAVSLQLILFVAHLFWFFLRETRAP